MGDRLPPTRQDLIRWAEALSGIAFTHVEEIGSLPMPADRMKGWDIRIGFDSKAGRGAQG